MGATNDTTSEQQHLADLYEAATVAALTLLARALSPGLGRPNWHTTAVARFPAFRRQLTHLLDRLDRATTRAAQRLERRAATIGDRAATVDLGHTTTVGEGRPNVAVLIQDLTVTRTRFALTITNAYSRALSAGLAGDVDPRIAVQRVLDRLARDGITGYIDRRGRAWSLDTWARTAVNVAATRIATQTYTDAITAAGYGLVIVSTSRNPCPRCIPYERRLLSLGHGFGTADTATLPVPVVGTLDEAIARGLMHPWCRHQVTAWQPGMPIVIPHGPLAGPRGDAEHAARLRYRARWQAARLGRPL